MIATRQPVVIRNPSEGLALGAGPIPGTDASQSLVTVPILGSDRILGSIVLENYEREDAFGESEVRLLSTVAASMGVALENARLFDETQRLLKETEQRAAELAVINSIQEGIAAELDFQAIVDLVGDKLREVFNTGDFGIVWHDAERNLMLPLYVYEHGVRLNIDPYPPLPTGGWSRLVASRQPSSTTRWGSRKPKDWLPWKAPTSPCLWHECRLSQATGCWDRSASRVSNANMRSAKQRSACWAPSLQAWEWRWRTRVSSTRRSDC